MTHFSHHATVNFALSGAVIKKLQRKRKEKPWQSISNSATSKVNVTADGYAGQIAIGSANFSVLRKVLMEAGNLSNRESGKPTWTGIEITKMADSSIATLLKEAATGSAGQEATITFVRTGSNKVEEYLVYKLTDCIISEYHFGGQGESQPVERMTLSYSAIEVSYKDHDASNKAGTPQRFRYDLKTAKAS